MMTSHPPCHKNPSTPQSTPSTIPIRQSPSTSTSTSHSNINGSSRTSMVDYNPNPVDVMKQHRLHHEEEVAAPIDQLLHLTPATAQMVAQAMTEQAEKIHPQGK